MCASSGKFFARGKGGWGGEGAVSSRSIDLLNSIAMINWSRCSVDLRWMYENRCYTHPCMILFVNIDHWRDCVMMKLNFEQRFSVPFMYLHISVQMDLLKCWKHLTFPSHEFDKGHQCILTLENYIVSSRKKRQIYWVFIRGTLTSWVKCLSDQK